MAIFIKLLVGSFPFALAVFLFWPAFENTFISSPPPVAVDASSVQPPVVEKYTPMVSTVPERPVPAKPSRPSRQDSAPSDSGIYRWVDERGRVVFSDKPSSGTAVAYTPAEIGYVQVSDDIKQRNRLNQVQLAELRASLISESGRNETYRVASQVAVAGYRFSNTSAGQKHGYVVLSGRISNGPACKRLRVSAYARSDMGGSVSRRDEVSYNGFGSTLFEMKIKSNWKGNGRRPQWEFANLSASCIGQKL